MDREVLREGFGGRAWGAAALFLIVLNLILLIVSVQILGAHGIDVHFASRSRMPRWAGIYVAALTLWLVAPLIAGIVGVILDKRKSMAWGALAGCVVAFIAYGCAAE